MIRHIAVWNVRDGSHGENLASVARVHHGFRGLRGCIPSLTHLEIGFDGSQLGYAGGVARYNEVESQAVLGAYASQSAHLSLRDELVGIPLIGTKWTIK